MNRLIVHATVEHADLRWGGIGTAVDLAARATVLCGLDAIVLAPGATEASSLVTGGYRVVTVSGGNDDPAYIYRATDRVELGRRLARRMLRTLNAERQNRPVDLVVHSEELTELLSAAAPEAWCTQAIAFTHGLAGQEHPGRADLADQQWSFFRDATRVCTASDAQARLAATMYPGVSFQSAPLPLELLVTDLEGHRRAGHTPPPGRFVAAGRAVPQKGFDVLLDAATRLRDRSDWTLRLFVGHGDEDHLKLLYTQSKHAGPAVRLAGWRSHDALMDEFAGAAAVIVPSRFEALGLVAAEALAVGTPVIASRTGGLAELLDGYRGTVFVSVGPDPAELAEALADAIDNPPPLPDPRVLTGWPAAAFVNRLLDLED